MKILIVIASLFLVTQINAQDSPSQKSEPDPTKKIQIVEASCGQCNFKLKGGGCDLAVRIDGKAYFVDGTKIDDHGDAHAEDGFCEAIRKAKVQGEIVDGRFQATYFKLVKKGEKLKKSKSK